MAFTVAVTEKVEQPLMARTLLRGVVEYDAAPPSFVELRRQLAASMKVDEGLLVVKSLIPVFGMRKSTLQAHVYKTKAGIESFGSKVTLKRNQPRAKKTAASS